MQHNPNSILYLQKNN